MSMTLVETVTLTSSSSRITFLNVPQDGTDLRIDFSLRSSSLGHVRYFKFTLNNNETGPYVIRTLRGYNGGVSSELESSQTEMQLGEVPAASATTNTFGNGSFYIPNYTSSTAKSISADIVTENNATQAAQKIIAASLNTGAVTRFDFFVLSPELFETNSTISLYKITKF